MSPRYPGCCDTRPQQNQAVSGSLLLTIEGPAILQLLSSEDETLLVRRDSFFVLNLGLTFSMVVGRFHFESNRFAGECHHEDCHSTTAGGFVQVNVVHGTSNTTIKWHEILFPQRLCT